MNKICKLNFDSKLANANIGKIIIDDESFDPAVVKRLMKRFDLVYVLSKRGPELVWSFCGFDWVFAGIKINLHLKLRSIVFPKIILSSKDFFKLSDKRELILLAQDLFKQSRFQQDSHTHRLGKKINTQWMKNSMLGSAADDILVSRDLKGSVIGFITVKKQNGFFEPVLIKVSDRYQGVGKGKNLMYKFFNYVATKNPQGFLTVNTMLHNTKALNFYHSFGFKVHDYQHVYHIYPKGFKKF